MDMKRLNAQDTLENRLEQAHSLVTALMMAGQKPNIDLSGQTMAGALWSVQELVGQAQGAFRKMLHERKPAVPVMCNGEPIPDLEKEIIAVLREMTKELEDVVVSGRGLLDDIDKRDKAAANAAPGGES